jgi:hypothetical protein
VRQNYPRDGTDTASARTFVIESRARGLDPIPQAYPALCEGAWEVDTVAVHHDLGKDPPWTTVIDQAVSDVRAFDRRPGTLLLMGSEGDVFVIDVLQQGIDNRAGARRPKNLQRPLTAREPAGQDDIGQVANMVIVIMAQKDGIDGAQGNTSTDTLQDHAAPGIEQQRLVAHLQHGGGRMALRVRAWPARTK